MKFSDWIHPNALQKWSLLHDTRGARYGIMGTDIDDAYKKNHVLKGVQCLPISAIVKVTLNRMEEYFKNTSDAANKVIENPVMNFPERVQDDMNSKMQKAQTYQVICMTTKDKNAGKDVGKFVVQSGQKHVIVHLDSSYTASMKKSLGCRIRRSVGCSCNEPQLLGKPCSHVIAVCSQIGVGAATCLSPYYTLSYLGNTWSRKSVVSETSYDYGKFGSATTTWIPDKKLECGLPVFQTSDCIQTGLDEEDQQ